MGDFSEPPPSILATQGEPTLGFNLASICQRQDVEFGEGGAISESSLMLAKV